MYEAEVCVATNMSGATTVLKYFGLAIGQLILITS